MQNNRKTGSRYEEQAAVFLEKQGFKILEHNFRCRSGEIDLIGRDGSFLAFIEVKYRKTVGCGEPAAAVDYRKQKRICDTARYYLLTHGYGSGDGISCRFDVVTILDEEISVIKDAFWIR